jgi:hypothetical protein
MTTPHQLRQWLADHKHLAGRDPMGTDADPRYAARVEELARLERAAGIRPHIAREGQARVDEPQYSTTRALPLAHSIASVFGRNIPEAVQVFEGYEPTRLRWMKPGPDGKLIPR